MSDSRIVRAIIFLITILASLRLSAQLQDISLRHYSTVDGLSDNNVRCILIDSRGFIWLGTDDGLNRFDGTEFITIRRHSGTKFSLSGNVITDIKEDRDSTLWISTRDGGICQLNTKTGHVFHPSLITPGGAEQTHVHCIYLGTNDEIYVGTDKGIYLSHDKRNFHLVKGCQMESCYDLEIHQQKVMAAINIRSLSCIVNDSLFPIAYKKPPAAPYPAHSLSDLYIDGSNTLWAAAWDNHLHKYNSNTEQFTHINILNSPEISYSDDEIVSITEPESGILWLAMKSFEIVAYNTKTEETQTINFSQRETSRLNGRRINFLFTDKQHRIWIGTDNGLHLRDPLSSRFDILSTGDESTVTDFAASDDNFYVTSTGGLFQFDEQENALRKISGNDPVRCYSILPVGENLLIGTNTSLQSFNTTNSNFSLWTEEKNTYFDVNNIASSQYANISTVNIGGKRLLMANPYGHGLVLGEFDKHRWVLFNVQTQDGLENLIRNIHQDKQGRIWILGSNYGLIRLDSFYLLEPKNVITFDTLFQIPNETFVARGKSFSNGLLSKEITAIVENADGSFWISTQGGGLYSLAKDVESSTFLPIASPWQSMQNMIADNNNNLWIIASGGLLQYEIKTNTWRRYDQRDGIPAAGLSKAMFMNNQNKIYLGGNGFVLSFDPNNLTTENEVPTPRLTHLSVMDQVMDTLLTRGTFTLDHDKNFLTFAFTGLCFSDPLSVIFEYRLDGLDEKWRNNGNDNKVSYSNLAPGEYTFRVRAGSRKGSTTAEEASITFTILKPFYWRWWFLSFVAIAISLVVWAIISYRKKQKEKIALVRNKIARDLHDDIGSALGSISFFSETAMRTLNDHNETSTQKVLEKIGSTSREMIENMHDIVWAVSTHNDGMQQMIDRMKSYAADMVSSDNIMLHFIADKEIVSLKLSMAERKNIFLVFKEAIYNSCKYSECRNIHVRLSKSQSDKLHLTITDDGIGFDTEQKKGMGNGLRNMRIRMEEIGAKIIIQSTPSKGTQVEIRL